jgi:hypothetical protein
MASPYSLFAASAVGPITPPCSPATDLGAGRDRVVQRTASWQSFDSVEPFMLDDDDDDLSGDDGEEDDDEEEELAQLAAAATRAGPSSLPVIEEGEVDLRREKGMGGQAKLRVAIVTGPSFALAISRPASGGWSRLTCRTNVQRTSCQRSTA